MAPKQKKGLRKKKWTETGSTSSMQPLKKISPRRRKQSSQQRKRKRRKQSSQQRKRKRSKKKSMVSG